MTDPTTQAYAELQQAFEHYNVELFDGQIPRCLITMQREKRTYGYYSTKRFVHRDDHTTIDEIAINPAYFGIVPLLEILQTLVHEMAHAWQQHFGNPGRRGYHNKEWADKMEGIGLMPSSTGKPGGSRTGEKMADYAIEGGLFMQATDKLLAAGFQVSWIDRFPPRVPHKAQLNVTTAIMAALSESLAAASETALLDQSEPDLGQAPELSELLSPPTAENRSNRVKYRCPNCTAQVWGKPNLKIRCGEDDCTDSVFEAVA